MTSEQAYKYLNKTVRVNYRNITRAFGRKQGYYSSRVGVITNVSLNRITLLIFNGEDNDEELYIPINEFTQIKQP